jgi:DNA-binding GntR family transcriptional regulator
LGDAQLGVAKATANPAEGVKKGAKGTVGIWVQRKRIPWLLPAQQLDIISNMAWPALLAIEIKEPAQTRQRMTHSLDPLAGHRPLADVVYQKLRDAIIDGQFEPNRWLRQEAVAQELGVSQMPVREALKRLVAEGLAERIPYRGVRVVEFTPQDLLDMATVRLVLESLAVRYAAEVIDDEALSRLEENLAQAAACTRPEEMDRRRRLNTDFHLAICRASGHRFLVHQVEALWRWFPSVMLYEGMRRQKALTRDRLDRESREHRTILSALQAHNAERAEAEMRGHIHHLSQELAEVLGLPKDSVEALT